MRSATIWLCGVVSMLTASAAMAAVPRLDPARYPKVERGAVVDDYHGTRVADPYRWLEQLDSPATAQFIAAQNALSRPRLDALPGYAALRERLGALYRYERIGMPVHAAGRYFFLRIDGQKDQAALQVSDSPTETGRTLIDPLQLRSDGTVAIDDFVPSPDGQWVAYALSDAGSDWKTWRVREVSTGTDLPDVLRDAKFTSVSWLPDSTGFYYSAYPGGDDKLQPVVRRHLLRAEQAADALVYAVADHPTRAPYAEVSEDGRYLVITLDEGTLSNGVIALPLNGGAAPQVVPVLTRYDGLNSYLGSRQGVGTELLFRTTSGAPRGRIIAVDLGRPGSSRERVVVPEADVVLEAARLVGDRLVLSYLRDARSMLRLHEAADGKLVREVALPGLGAITALGGKPSDRDAFFGYTDYTTPTQILRLPVGGGESQLVKAPQFAADVSAYVTEQVFYASRDGTRVPMFVVHRRDFKRDASAPVMLYGYGGFDISMTPAFSPAVIAWLEMGGVYVVANLRGGGEYGSAWHEAGTRTHKQNVFDDFIAAAEFLVKERWAAPRRIVIRGGSNGGLLVGAVLEQRPELFGAALPDVGVHDMLRYHLASANARQWSDDFGLSENAEDFRAQHAYSPVHNARRACYPPTLITTAAQDNRVVPWHSFKFAAALQRAQRCDNPVLLRVETRAGHGAGKPLWMQVDHYAEAWAFSAAALGMSVPAANKPSSNSSGVIGR
jgi:prolyl oligopeptidase